MKKILVLLLFISLSATIFAQSNRSFNFGLGGALSSPSGDLSDATIYGAGIEAKVKFNISNSLELFGSTGVHAFKGKTISLNSTGPNFTQIPIAIGADFKFSGIFVGAGIGYGLWSVSDGGSYNGFMYMPHIGYTYEKWEVLFNYNSTIVSGGSLSYLGLKFFRYF